MTDSNLPILGLKLIVFGFQVTILGRFVFESFTIALIGGVISLFALFVQ